MTQPNPFPTDQQPYSFSTAGLWPANWVLCPGAEQPPAVAVYRLRFELAPGESASVPVYVTADERYELYLDGKRIGRGPERGDLHHWFYETYTLELSAGAHVLAARSWHLGDMAAIAQFSLRPGFLLCPADEAWWDKLATGRAAWEAKKLEGYSFTSPLGSWFVGYKIDLDGTRYAWGWERGGGDGWLPVKVVAPAGTAGVRAEQFLGEHHLLAGMLPQRLDAPRHLGKVRNISAPALSETHSIPVRAAQHIPGEEPGWSALLRGEVQLMIPANTRRRVIVDLEDYYCAYPEVVVSGGEAASLRLHWQEALYENTQNWDKGRRGEVEGKLFTSIWHNRDGLGDLYHLDGGKQRRLDTLWWHAGRYVEILVETSNQPLTLESLVFYETRYPLERESRFDSSDPRMQDAIRIMVRALQVCAHETYMDCPYYEQLMYAGDTRLECLVTYTITHDDRLPRKALRCFDWSRLPEGLTQSRYPSRILQMIPPFSLWWVAMVADFWMYRGDVELTRDLLRGVRGVLDTFTALRGEDGLLRSPQGWNFMDWVPAWKDGIPPGGMEGEVCGVLNWQYVLALRLAAGVEQGCGDDLLAGRWLRLAKKAAEALAERYWDAGRRLYADDEAHTVYTEHSQCLAVLSGLIPEEHRAAIARSLFAGQGLTQTTVYFMHYFFETCRELGRMDAFFERMKIWFEMVDYDFKTTYESGNPHDVRSDCHAWGSHPLFHYFASVLGIRPSEPGFKSVEILPQLGPLQRAGGTLVHPGGEIRAEFHLEGGSLHGRVELPAGVAGTLLANGHVHALSGGRFEF